MSELVNYYRLDDKPEFKTDGTIISGKYVIQRSYNDKIVKFGYEETFTTPMLNYLIWLDKVNDTVRDHYNEMYGQIRVRAVIFYAYAEYYYTYYHYDGTETYYLKVLFNGKDDQESYVLPASLTGEKITEIDFVNSILDDASAHLAPDPDEPEPDPEPVYNTVFYHKKIDLSELIGDNNREYELSDLPDNVANSALLYNGQEYDYGKDYTIDGGILILDDSFPELHEGSRLVFKYYYTEGPIKSSTPVEEAPEDNKSYVRKNKTWKSLDN